MKLTILIPALNEEKTIGIVIQKAKQFLKEQNISGEILISNNGSTDRTKNIAIKNGVNVIDVPQRGYGCALRNGIQQANGDYIIMGDADDSYNFLELRPFVDYLEKGYDIVVGNRFFDIEKGAMKFTHRYLGTPFLSYLARKKYHVPIKDLNCGLRSFRRDSIKKLNLKSIGMEFASEMLIMASKKKLKIKEVPIHFYKDKREKNSHLSTIRDGFRHLLMLLRN